MLALGISLAILAVTSFVYGLFAPAAPRVRRERRVVPGTTVGSPIERVVSAMERIVDGALRKRGWNPFPAHDLELAGIRLPQSSLVTSIIALAFLALLIGYVVGGIALGMLLGLAVPAGSRFVISVMRSKRRAAFADQLESTLEVIRSALRAGHSLPSALNTVAEDAEDPTGSEFARIVNANRLGEDIIDAMRTTAERMGSEDFGWIADAAAIQRTTGGNLAEVIERVGATLRERNELHKKIRAISSEGRMSGWVMMAIPLFLAGVTAYRNPDDFAVFFTTSIGWMLVAGCAALYLIGFVWMRRLVIVKV